MLRAKRRICRRVLQVQWIASAIASSVGSCGSVAWKVERLIGPVSLMITRAGSFSAILRAMGTHRHGRAHDYHRWVFATSPEFRAKGSVRNKWTRSYRLADGVGRIV